MFRLLAAFALLAVGCLAPLPVHAAMLPEGTKTITLISPDGARQSIGEVTFTPDGDGATFTLKLTSPELQEQFLSMRPFQCLSGPKEQWCNLTYDYGLRRRVTASDLVDLEYSLMFFWRTYDRVHADPWNGLYFKLKLEPDGSLSGPLFETDLGVLATPPKDAFARPVLHKDMTPSQPGRRQFERIEIK